MERRDILVAGASSPLVIGGCLGDLRSAGDATDTSDVPGCAEKAKWDDATATEPADPDPQSIAGRRDCASASRPEPTGAVCETFARENENGTDRAVPSAGIRPYPAPPSAFGEKKLRSFVSGYERAYTQNAAVLDDGKYVVEFSFDTIETQTIDRYENVTGIVIAFGFGFRVEGEGYTDSFGSVAVYGIDETGVVRRKESYGPGEIDTDEIANPVEDGELLECF